MSDLQSDTLYNAVRNSDKISLNKSNDHTNDKYLIPCCCVTDKWCFEHSGIAIPKQYSETEFNCCTCLDCCTWCLEVKIQKYSICVKQTNCYLCCCSIYFI
jgi:hypothetical protein